MTVKNSKCTGLAHDHCAILQQQPWGRGAKGDRREKEERRGRRKDEGGDRDGEKKGKGRRQSNRVTMNVFFSLQAKILKNSINIPLLEN